jgi:hypothetical protein
MRLVKPLYGASLGVPHEWSRPITVEYAFRTAIVTARSGRQQRAAERDVPRMAVSVNLLDWADRRQRFQTDLMHAQSEVMFVPLPWRATTLEAVNSPTEVVLPTPVPAWVLPGAYLWIDGAAQEAVRIASVAGTVLTLADPLQGAHGPAEKVLQALPGRVPNSLSMRAPVPGLWQGDVRIELEPGNIVDPFYPLGTPPGPDLPAWWPGPSSIDYADFRSLVVLMRKPNWQDAMQITTERERDTVDLGFGRTRTFERHDFSTIGYRMKFTFRSPSDTERFCTFFRVLYGQRTPFWMPSHSEDFRDVQPLLSNGFSARNTGQALFDGSPTHGFVVARWPTGERQFNEVQAVGANSNRVEVLCATNWIRSVSEARIEWLLPMRFASDTLTVAWLTPLVAEATITMVTTTLAEMEDYDA